MKIKSTLLMAAALLSAPAMSADYQAGKKLAAACAACHSAGDNAVGPVLAGQHADYLYRALLAYKTGDRVNGLMNPQSASLSEADMKNVSAYFAAQDGLKIVPTGK